jgi:hypothetical protein
MEEKSEYITKADLRDAFRDFVPQLVEAIDKRFEPRFRKIESDIADVKSELAVIKIELVKRPTRDEVPTKDEICQIVRKEMENVFTRDTFKLTLVK